jgi:hypothetical protein
MAEYEESRRRLIERLVAQGWAIEGGWIYAPHRSMWLDCSRPWEHDGADMLERMRARLRQIERFRAEDIESGASRESAADTTQLVEVLEELVQRE